MSCDVGLNPYSALFLLVMFLRSDSLRCSDASRSAYPGTNYRLVRCIWQISDMHKDWGYAALVEYGGKRILFDTGNNPDILAHNAQVKGIRSFEVGFCRNVAPPRDQHGGLSYVLKVNQQ